MKFICSKIIEEGKSIDIPRTENPGKTKSFDIKRKHALFSSDASGKYKIPENANSVSFPDYHENNYHVHYGEPVFA